jgi:hypothetical protein
MTEPQTYHFESEDHQIYVYQVAKDGLTYQAPGRKSTTMRWEDIQYLEDISGLRVDIVRNGEPATIPIFYHTHQFSDLLTLVCSKLATLHHHQIGTQTFKGSLTYFIHRGIVLALMALLFLASVIYQYEFTALWLFMAAVTLPMMGYILLQPHAVTPLEDGLSLQDFMKTRFIAYDRIKAIAFNFHGDRQVSFLCILIHLTNGRKIKIQRFENLILLFIFIMSRWHMAGETGTRGAPPKGSDGDHHP